MGPLVKLGRDFTRPGPLKGSFLEGKSLAIFRKSRLVKYHSFANKCSVISCGYKKGCIRKFSSSVITGWVTWRVGLAILFHEDLLSWCVLILLLFQRYCIIIFSHVVTAYIYICLYIYMPIYIYIQEVQADLTLRIGRIGNPESMDHPKPTSLCLVGWTFRVFFILRNRMPYYE